MSDLPDPDPRRVGLGARPAAFRLGFLAAAWQVLLLREFASQFYGSELSFGFVLAFWLLWGGLGSRAAAAPRLTRIGVDGFLGAALVGAPLAFALLRLSGPPLGLLPGEVTGFGPILAFAAAASLPIGFALGAAFTRAAAQTGPAAAYLWESAGAAVGAGLAYGLLIPFLPAGASLAVVGVLGALSSIRRGVRGTRLAAVAAAAAWSCAPAVLDGPGLALRWRPFDLALTRDTPGGRVQVVQTGGEATVYENGLKAFAAADASAREAEAGFALLQKPRAGRVLILGGILSGLATEALRYGPALVDIVEPNPSLVDAVRPYLPAADRAALDDSRVRLTAEDGRVFLQRGGEAYDVVLIGLPDPATAQMNRYYTVELFRLAASRLTPDGVLSFRASAAENYVGPDLARYLGTMEKTAKAAFPNVEVAPGDEAVFLASKGALTLAPDRLADELDRRGLATASFNRELLRSRLHPLRRDRLRSALDAAKPVLNTDERPISYYFHARLWSAQTRGPDSAVLARLASLPPTALLAAFIVPFALAAAAGAARSRRGGGKPAAYPFAVLGLTTMAAEWLWMVRYQTLHGGLYGRLALLIGLYMAGTTAGALAARRSRIGGRTACRVMPLTAAAALGLSAAGADRLLGAAGFAGLFAAWGFWGGFFFTALSRALPTPASGAGRGYAADLLGAFAGAVVPSAILLPLAGLDSLFIALAALALILFAALSFDRRLS